VARADSIVSGGIQRLVAQISLVSGDGQIINADAFGSLLCMMSEGGNTTWFFEAYAA
jgi:hypothetical protein